VFKKLFNATERAGGIIPKIEKVMRLISFLVLVLDTLRFFKTGLEKLSSKNEEHPKNVAADSANSSEYSTVAP